VHHEEDSQEHRPADGDPPVEKFEVRCRDGTRIGERGEGFFERHAVLREIGGALSLIPLEIPEDDGCHPVTIRARLRWSSLPRLTTTS